MKISAVIIAGNEEANIADALSSVEWADEVLVIDSESTDRTREVAEVSGAKVITRPWPGFSAQKQSGVEEAENDWIFSLDADERVSDELKNEILEIRENGPAADGYRVPRLAIYMGRGIRHGGWYPDWQLRLFDRRRGRWSNAIVHESVTMDAGSTVAKLKGHIFHQTCSTAAEHHRMIGERYAPLAAEQMFKSGRRSSPVRMAAAGPAAFFSTYIVKAGFLDGLEGYQIAKFAAHHAFLKHACLLELQRRAEKLSRHAR